MGLRGPVVATFPKVAAVVIVSVVIGILGVYAVTVVFPPHPQVSVTNYYWICTGQETTYLSGGTYPGGNYTGLVVITGNSTFTGSVIFYGPVVIAGKHDLTFIGSVTFHGFLITAPNWDGSGCWTGTVTVSEATP